MKRYILSAVSIIIFSFSSMPQGIVRDSTSLIIIDIQNFYFAGGKLELVNSDDASKKAAEILDRFRKENMQVVHIKHNIESGGEIHSSVRPQENEKIITKDEVNAFKGTGLQQFLVENGIKYLVLCGMQTHMCLEGTVRAAGDLGYMCTVISDACATRDLIYENKVIIAEDVHLSTLSTLDKTYSTVLDSKSFLEEF